jgi:hypothetical protein
MDFCRKIAFADVVVVVVVVCVPVAQLGCEMLQNQLLQVWLH